MGFRFQASRLARSLGLTGYVRNLWDGRVELEAQGEEAAVENLVTALRRQPYIDIEGVEAEDRPLRDENGFQMTY